MEYVTSPRQDIGIKEANSVTQFSLTDISAERRNTEAHKIRHEVHDDTGLGGNRAFNRLKYHKLVFYPPYNGYWITHGIPMRMIS